MARGSSSASALFSVLCRWWAWLVGLSTFPADPVSHEYYQFLLSFILFGTSAALVYTPSVAVLSHWFERKRGLTVGIVVCGSGIGGILYPIIFERGFATIGMLHRDSLTPRLPEHHAHAGGPEHRAHDSRRVLHEIQAAAVSPPAME